MLSFKISFNYEEKTLHIECEKKLHYNVHDKRNLIIILLKENTISIYLYEIFIIKSKAFFK